MIRPDTSPTSRFCATDATAAVLSFALLAAFFLPAIAQLQRNDEQTRCLNNARQIARGVLDFEDARTRLPLASTQWITAKPGSVGGMLDSAGYSWLVMVLPYIGENELYSQLSKSSDRFAKALYDPAVSSQDSAGGLPSRNHVVTAFVCPAVLAARTDQPGAAGSPTVTQAMPAANSSYHAFAGTHFYNRDGIGRLVPPDRLLKRPDGRMVPNGFEGNGAICFPGLTGERIVTTGLRLSHISDGPSKTLLFAESSEERIATWMDGQLTWLVAAWPETPEPPGELPQVGIYPILAWKDDQLPNNWTSVARSAAHDGQNPASAYMPAGRWSAGETRHFGPSSRHGNVVAHAFVDGNAKMLAVDIDKNVYLHLVTRSGRETVPEEVTRWDPGAKLIFRDDTDIQLRASGVDKSKEFQFSIPETWSVGDVERFRHSVLLLPRRDAFNRNVLITDQPGASSLDQLKTLYERDLPKAFKDFKLIESKVVTLPNQAKAVKIIHTNRNPGVEVRQVNYIIELGQKRYFVICTALETDGSQFDEVFESVVDSIRAVDEAK